MSGLSESALPQMLRVSLEAYPPTPSVENGSAEAGVSEATV
jgi:hypothetical protein